MEFQKQKKLSLLFWGTSAFAKLAFEALHGLSRFRILGVVCAPDRPSGRGLQTHPCPVKTWAVAERFPVYQPEKISELRPTLELLSPDAALVIAYGKILPAWCFDNPSLFPLGIYNVHASLLPRHRGASPIRAALRHGDTVTGLSIQKMVPTLDAGPVWFSRLVPISIAMDFDALHARLEAELPHMMRQFAERFPPSEGDLVSQDETAATWSRKDTVKDADIDLAQHRPDWLQLRAYLSHPGVWIWYGGERLFKIRRARYCDQQEPCAVDSPLYFAQGRLELRCVEGHRVEVETLQVEGRAPQTPSEWARGYGQMLRFLQEKGVLSLKNDHKS